MNTTTGYRDHTLIGTPDQVGNVLLTHAAAGTLIATTAPRPISATDPRVWVRLRLADTSPDPASSVTRPAPAPVVSLADHITGLVQPGSKRRTRRIVAVSAAATTAAAALIAMAVYLVGQLVAFLTDHAALIAGLLAVAALITALLTRTVSGKRHCPGC
jgi:hypothetical protein